MRAVAVLGVVIYHLRASWLPGGFAGVDVFFVLSGYFITGHLLREVRANGSVDLLRFWTRRIRRLLPAATLTVTGTLLAALVVADPLDGQRFARDGGYAAVFSLNWHLAREGTSYFADPAPSPFTHFWSLGVEEQFYLVWPVLLLLVAIVVRSARAVRPVVLVLVAGASVASFGVALIQTHGAQPYAYFATYSRVWELGVGAALAAAGSALGRLPVWLCWLLRWGGVAAVVGFYVRAPLDATYPGWYLLVPAVGAALVVAAGVGPGRGLGEERRRDPLAVALASPPGQLIGRYSYGWYLWHWGPLVLFPLLLGHSLTAVELWACAAGALVLAALSFHLVEEPIRVHRGLAIRRGGRSAVLGVGLVTVSLIGSVSVYAVAHFDAVHSHVVNARGADLVPQPARAASELPQPTRDGCEVSLSSSGRSPECRYLPDSGHGDVVLAGDSHAAQWFPAVEAIARRQQWGLRVWAKASCPIADITKNINGAPGKACDSWREDVMRRLIEAKPSLVIVTGYASVVPSIYDRASGHLVGGAGARRLYEQGLERELRRLRAAAIPVLLIRDNPSFDVSGPKCALEHEHHLAACSATLQHALRSAEDLHAAQAVPGVHWVDFTSTFCAGGRCRQVVGSTLAYRDTNHLTAEMTHRLEPALAAAATGAMTAPH
jgi:peptidoglycan/LPS O-acetylase OafA/YrhL